MGPHVVIIWSSFMFLLIAQGTATNCTRKCTIDDKDLTCWKQSVDYFTEEAVRNIDRYSSILVHFAKWRERQTALAAENEDFVEKELKQTLDDMATALSREDMQEIMSLIVNKSHHLAEERGEELPPSVRCPIPCSYDATVWRSLFFFMLTITVLSIFTMVTYVFCFLKPGKGTYVLTRQTPDM